MSICQETVAFVRQSLLRSGLCVSNTSTPLDVSNHPCSSQRGPRSRYSPQATELRVSSRNLVPHLPPLSSSTRSVIGLVPARDVLRAQAQISGRPHPFSRPPFPILGPTPEFGCIAQV